MRKKKWKGGGGGSLRSHVPMKPVKAGRKDLGAAGIVYVF
jgi:hypothetical protein